MPESTPSASTASTAQSSVHALLIRTQSNAFLVPSAMVAEVIATPAVEDTEFKRPGIAGRIMWRGIHIPLVSLDSLLLKDADTETRYPRTVVFYPLPRRREHDFFGVGIHSNPRSLLMEAKLAPAAMPEHVDARYVASPVHLNGQAVLIPDVEALADAIY